MHECLNIIITNSKKGAGTVLKFAKVLAWHFTRFPRNCLYKDYTSFVDTFFFDFFIDKCAVLKWRIQLLSLVYHTSQGKAFEIMSSLNVTLTLFWSSLILEVRRAFFASKKYSYIHQIAQIYDQILKSLLSIERNWN